MANGIVKWFDEKKGFGFVEQEDGSDVFFHFSGSTGLVLRLSKKLTKLLSKRNRDKRVLVL